MKKTNIRLLATFAMLATAVLPGWADLIVETDFQRKMPVAFSGYAGTSSLTNFPALVKFDTSIDGFSYDLFAEGGVNGTFNTPDVPKPALLTYTATTVEYTVPPAATLIILH